MTEQSKSKRAASTPETSGCDWRRIADGGKLALSFRCEWPSSR